MLRQLVKLLPTDVYQMVKRRYRAWQAWRRSRWPKLTAVEFRRIVEEVLQVRRGAVLFVHSSCQNLNLGFPVFQVLGILQEVVGPEGTLLFPCTHLSERAEDYLRRNEVFDVRKSVTSMGILPELARRHPQALRTCHPTNSIVALGKNARELTESHCRSIYPCGEGSPYYKIVEHDGVIVGLGVHTTNISFMHCIEDIWRERFPFRTRTEEVFAGRVITANGEEQIVRTLAQSRITQKLTPRSVPKFIRRHVRPEVCRDLTFHGANYFVARSRPLYATLEDLARRGITLYGTVGPGRSRAA